MAPRVSVFSTNMSSVSRRRSPVFAFLSFIAIAIAIFAGTLQRQLPVFVVESHGTPLVENVVAEYAIHLLAQRRFDLGQALCQHGALLDLLAANSELPEASLVPLHGCRSGGGDRARRQGVKHGETQSV